MIREDHLAVTLISLVREIPASWPHFRALLQVCDLHKWSVVIRIGRCRTHCYVVVASGMARDRSTRALRLVSLDQRSKDNPQGSVRIGYESVLQVAVGIAPLVACIVPSTTAAPQADPMENEATKGPDTFLTGPTYSSFVC